MIYRAIMLALALALALGCAAFAQVDGEVCDSPPGIPVWLNNVRVTLSNPTECYIEEPSRAAGLRVVGDCTDISVGDEVTVVGILTTSPGERYVANATITNTNAGLAVAPLAMNNLALGGAHNVLGLRIWDYTAYKTPEGDIDWQWTQAGGCPNIGLLVKTWGVVKNTYYSPTTGARWFHIDDGSRVTSDLADTGIIVYSDAPVQKGQFVTVTGISGAEPAIDMADKLVRVLRTRSVSDVLVWKEPKPVYPFSDEFEGEKLDWRWDSHQYCSPVSLEGDVSLDSGWLKLSIPAISGSGVVIGPFIDQNGARCDWNLEAKLRLVAAPSSARQGIVVAVQSWGANCDGPADEAPGPYANYLAAVYTTLQTSNSTTHVCVAGQPDYRSGANDTWYFSIRKRGNTLYGSVSPDGVSYSDEVTSTCGDFRSFYVYTYSCSVDRVVYPVSGYVDYVRITPVNQ